MYRWFHEWECLTQRLSGSQRKAQTQREIETQPKSKLPNDNPRSGCLCCAAHFLLVVLSVREGSPSKCMTSKMVACHASLPARNIPTHGLKPILLHTSATSLPPATRSRPRGRYQHWGVCPVGHGVCHVAAGWGV